MKRLHVHVAVDDLAKAIAFYQGLFDTPPTRKEADYAKWQLDDPRVNFAISQKGTPAGVEHLGIEVETPEELTEVYDRMAKADAPVLEEGKTVCCYARSEKSWVTDPAGVSWEVFRTFGGSTVYGSGPSMEQIRLAGKPATAALATGAAKACC